MQDTGNLGAVATTAILELKQGSRRGACPTLDAPMRTGDGLLARIRIAGRSMSPGQLAEIGRLASVHGNGLIEITARGNLQIRGLRPETAPLLAGAIALLLPLETGLGIDISPLAGSDPLEKADAADLAGRIREAASPLAAQLGPKISVVIDGAGQISLAALKADIRLYARDRHEWSVTLGGGKPQVMDADGAISATVAVLGALAALGPLARASDLFPARAKVQDRAAHWHSRYALTHGHALAIALPFGQAPAEALVAMAKEAAACNVAKMRLAPQHTLLFDNAESSLLRRAGEFGFIVDANDPRRRISACIGSDGCSSGLIRARHIAERLAATCPPDRHLHVSGCAKGCAHPRRADATLVGRHDGIGLVIRGRAGDTPDSILDGAALDAGFDPFQDGQ